MGRKLRSGTAVIGVALVAALGAEVGKAEESERGSFDLQLSTRAPGQPTGLSFHLVYKNPEDPEGKPPALLGAEINLPAGLAIDDTAVPRCEATDEEFRSSGRAACPVESRVGEGTLQAVTGFPGADPVHGDIVAFNGDGELIEVVFFAGTNVVAGIDRLTVEPGKLVAHPPSTPGGPPDGRTTIREIELEVPARVGDEGRPYVTAPPRCPRGGWVSRARYDFADGGSASLASVSPCAKPRLAVDVRPRRVRAGVERTIRISVTSADPSCVQAARARVGGRSARPGPSGRTRIRVRFARPGVRRVVVISPGCRPAKGAIRVRPAR